MSFREGSRVRQTSEESRRTYRPKRCENNNKDEDNSPKNLNDKNQQDLSQKFRQLISVTGRSKRGSFFTISQSSKNTFIIIIMSCG